MLEQGKNPTRVSESVVSRAWRPSTHALSLKKKKKEGERKKEIHHPVFFDWKDLFSEWNIFRKEYIIISCKQKQLRTPIFISVTKCKNNVSTWSVLTGWIWMCSILTVDFDLHHVSPLIYNLQCPHPHPHPTPQHPIPTEFFFCNFSRTPLALKVPLDCLMFPKSKEAPPHPHPHKKKTTSLNICTTLLLTNRYSTRKWRYPVCISAPFCRVVLKPCVVDALLSKWHKYNRDAEVNACPQSLPEQNSTLHWNLHTHTHTHTRARARARAKTVNGDVVYLGSNSHSAQYWAGRAQAGS